MQIVAFGDSGCNEAGHGGITDVFREKGIEVVGVMTLVLNRLLDHFRSEGTAQIGRESLDDFAHDIVVTRTPGLHLVRGEKGQNHPDDRESCKFRGEESHGLIGRSSLIP